MRKNLFLLISSVILCLQTARGADALPATSDFRLLPKAPQLFYQDGVVHTDRHGTILTHYQPDQSFLPIWMYGMKHPRTGYLCFPGKHPDKSNLEILKDAGFNSAEYIGEVTPGEAFLQEANRLKLAALMYWQPLNRSLAELPAHRAFLKSHAKDDAILGWVMTEETGHYLEHYKAPLISTVEQWQRHFHALKQDMRALVSQPVLIIDDLWLSHHTERTSQDPDLVSWKKWADISDISALDIYATDLKSAQTLDQSGAIDRALPLARDVSPAKPQWILLNTFVSKNPKSHLDFPSPTQLRNLVYSALVHGATGIGYFAMDDYAMRAEQLTGIRPDTPLQYRGEPDCTGIANQKLLKIDAATADQSRELWRAVAQVNAEIAELTPDLLSPTSRRDYDIAVRETSVSETPLRSLLKQKQLNFTLMVTNLDKRVFHARIRIDSGGIKTIHEVFEKRDIAVRPLLNEASPKSEFKDEFSPFAVHVYRWRVDRPQAKAAAL